MYVLFKISNYFKLVETSVVLGFFVQVIYVEVSKEEEVSITSLCDVVY